MSKVTRGDSKVPPNWKSDDKPHLKGERLLPPPSGPPAERLLLLDAEPRTWPAQVRDKPYSLVPFTHYLFSLSHHPLLLFTVIKGMCQWFSLILTRVCRHHRNLISEHFHHPKKKPCACYQLVPLLLSFHPWEPLVYFLFADLLILDVSHKRNHTIRGLLYLASFTYHVFKSSSTLEQVSGLPSFYA